MKHTTITGWALLALAAAGFLFAGIEASGAPEPTSQAMHRTHVKRIPIDPLSVDAPRDARRIRIHEYTLDMMDSWPKAIIPHADYADIAEDIAAVVLENPSPTPDQDAAMLATLGYFEGARYALYVDSGECNDRDWRKYGVEEEEGTFHKSHERGLTFSTSIWTSEELMHVGGDCDGGYARGLGQVHGGWMMDKTWVTLERLADRRFMFRAMLWLARADVSLCAYAGENPAFGCPKATLRLEFARRAIAKHPFVELPRE
jgi:hypothetical protein